MIKENELRKPYKSFFTEKVGVPYKYHSIQIPLEKVMSEKDFSFSRIQDQINLDDLYTDPEDDSCSGLENEPHVTVLYGLTKEEDYFKVRRLLDKKVHPFEIVIGDISVFDSKPDYDVLKIDIYSPNRGMNSTLTDTHEELKANFDNVYSYPEYHAHMTLAYIKKGSCKELLGKSNWTGTKYMISELEWSHIDGYKLILPLWNK